MNTVDSNDFLPAIPTETKQLLELQYTLYTDGSCDTSKRGGWAFVLVDNKNKRTVKSGSVVNATNNMMELNAIVQGLEYIDNLLTDHNRRFATIKLVSDSTYCTNSLREWIHNWVSSGDIAKRPNNELLLRVYPLLLKYQTNLHITWQARNTHECLTLCDTLSNQERTSILV